MNTVLNYRHHAAPQLATVLLGLLLSFTAGFSQAAAVYKWTDENGVETYSDRATDPGATRLRQAKPSSKVVELDPQELRRRQKCAAARAELKRYQTYEKIFLVSANESGQREMSDEERDRAVINTRQDIQVWCGEDVQLEAVTEN